MLCLLLCPQVLMCSCALAAVPMVTWTVGTAACAAVTGHVGCNHPAIMARSFRSRAEVPVSADEHAAAHTQAGDSVGCGGMGAHLPLSMVTVAHAPVLAHLEGSSIMPVEELAISE